MLPNEPTQDPASDNLRFEIMAEQSEMKRDAFVEAQRAIIISSIKLNLMEISNLSGEAPLLPSTWESLELSQLKTLDACLQKEIRTVSSQRG
jgi:hypothetical protein